MERNLIWGVKPMPLDLYHPYGVVGVVNAIDFHVIFWQYCMRSSSNNWLSSVLHHLAFKRQAITWSNADPVHWRIYAALGSVCVCVWGGGGGI